LGLYSPVLSHDQKLRLVTLMSAHIPHAALLGIQVESVVGEELTLKLPFQNTLIGDAEAGTLHGGALTVLLDQTLGLATLCSNLGGPAVTPTLDLRIDHLRIAPPGMDVYATAKVYRSTRKILFVEGVAYCESREKPIARATGCWVRVGDVDLSWLLAAELEAQQE
jgi:uncharacterized protein (TIGR00369 family)